MNNKLSIHHYDYDSMFTSVESRFSDTISDYILKAVFFKDREPYNAWSLLSTSIRPHDKKIKTKVTEYQEYAFLEMGVNFQSPLSLMQAISFDGILTTEELSGIIVPPNTGKYWEEILIPSWVQKTGSPQRLFTIETGTNHSGNDTPLVAHGLEYIHSANEFIKQFLDVPHPYSNRFGIHIFLADESCHITPKDRAISCELADEQELKGLIQLSNGDSVLVESTDDISDTDLNDVSDINLWVVDENNVVRDHLANTAYPFAWKNPFRNPDLDEIVKQALQSGEGPEVEFKSFINVDKKGSKNHELVVTTCALSNTHGGIILIGVDDFGNPTDINGELTRIYKKNLEDASELYCQSINKLLSDSLTNTDCFEVQLVQTAGIRLCAITVSKVNQPNLIAAEQAYYERHGATSKKQTEALLYHYHKTRGGQWQ